MVRTTLIAGHRVTRRAGGGPENENVSKQDHRESSWHHLCELLCETISRDSRRRRCESRSTVTILVRSGRYNVAGQCLSIQTSVSDVATRLLDVRVPWPHGSLLIQLFVPERDWSRLASHRTCERQLCASSWDMYLSIPLCNIYVSSM